jgi:hypothetical protein
MLLSLYRSFLGVGTDRLLGSLLSHPHTLDTQKTLGPLYTPLPPPPPQVIVVVVIIVYIYLGTGLWDNIVNLNAAKSISR